MDTAGHHRLADHGLLALSDPTLEAVFWGADQSVRPSAWWPQLPFGHWAVAATRPSLLVDLGTSDGVSFAAFCQAVDRAKVPAHCYAVAPETQPAPDDLVGSIIKRFGAFATVLRSGEPHDQFEDGSVDLLHLDGCDGSGAAERLYQAWQSKLSERAIVLIHGASDLAGDGSARRLWRGLREQHPSFEFTHGRGLGVVAVGAAVPEPIRVLCSLESSEHIAALRARFSQLGERWAIEARSSGAAVAAELKARLEQAEREAAQARADAAEARLDANRDILAEQARVEARVEEARLEAARTREDVLRLIEEARKQNEQDRIDSARLAEAAQARLEVRHRSELAELRFELETAAHATKAVEAVAERLRVALQVAQTEFERAEAEAMRRVRSETERGRADGERLLAAERERARAETARALQSERAAIAGSMAALRSELHQVNVLNADLSSQLAALRGSTAWKLTWPLRQAGTKSPPWLRRGLRRTAKLGWWTVTMKLPSRMRVAAPRPADMLPSQTPALASQTDDWPAIAAPESGVEGVTLATSARLVYVSGEAHTPGHSYRVERFVATAAELGHRAVAITPPEVASNLNEIAQADILVLWRTTWGPEVAQAVAAARQAGARVVFDVDDLMIDPCFARAEVIDAIRSASLDEGKVVAHFAAVEQCMREADVCFTTTEELAYHLRGRGKRTHVLANGFDRTLHAVARQARQKWLRTKRDTLFRIGYAGGSRTHQRDFGCAVQAIAKLMHEMPSVTLVLFQTPDGQSQLVDVAEFPSLAGLEHRIEWRSLQPVADLPNELARFDVNIAPLETGNPFCEAKSELKFWEAGLVEVPTVASPTGPFRRAIRHGKTGFLAASADDWHYYLKQLADDAGLRESMARAAYFAALASFGPVDRKLRFSRVIEQLLGGQAGANAFALDAHLAARPKRPVSVFPSDVVFHKPGATVADVTVVVPLYNYEHHVVEALDSVAAQTLGVLDLVIVEGCSTDNSLAVAKAWAERNAPRFNRLLLLHNRSNYGLGFCRNSGFEAAETPYIMPLDADNRLRPACCQALLAAIRETGAAYVYPSIQLFGDSEAIICAVPYDPKGFVPSNYIDAMAMVDREAWAFVGGYDHVRHGWEDYDFWCRLAETGLGGAWHREVLADYRVHSNSIIRTLHNENYRRLFEDFTRRHPWVALGEQEGSRRAPPPRPQLTPLEQQTRLDSLLPLLRCPQSHGKLAFDEAREALVNLDGLRRWAIVDGRPILTKDARDLARMPATGLVTAVPQRAIELAEAASGFVIHLNAGMGLIGLQTVIAVDPALFPHTDIVADADDLPFDDECVGAVILCSGLQQFRDPGKVVAEIHRVLKPQGQVFIQAPFLEPGERAAPQYFRATRLGLETWLKVFQADVMHVPHQLRADRSFARLAVELSASLEADVSAAAAAGFGSTDVRSWIEHEGGAPLGDGTLAPALEQLTEATQERLAAGFEFVGHKAEALPDLKAEGSWA